jgi:hypothetical protein
VLLEQVLAGADLGPLALDREDDVKISGLSMTPSASSFSTMSGRSVCGAMKISLSAGSGPGSPRRFSIQTRLASAATAMMTRKDMKPDRADRVGLRLLGGFGGGGGGASGWRASLGLCGVILRAIGWRTERARSPSEETASEPKVGVRPLLCIALSRQAAAVPPAAA